MTNREPSVSQYKSKCGLKRIFSALFNSLNGLRTAWRLEHAFRQELGVAIPGIIVALLLPVTLLERVALIAVLVLMLITELVNSAIEAVVDRISLDHHELSKNAKDLGSAAVMLAVVLAVLTWAVILGALWMR
ncbi:MAG: diacylglycerol kinase [Betaproteobacteria bacterium]|nr:diacylglycerol kinase [Betaproteobacteria bacterium]